ncbi:MAG TPA: Rrf2 family transcriptional regulator [Planctomycetota bacterium]
MKISQKSEYAFRAMLELALRLDQTQTVRTAEIARSQRIPVKFLELILVDLRRAGLIISQRGPEGGHRLARNAKSVTVGEIWRAIEGAIIERPMAELPRGYADPFHTVWRAVDKAVASVVDGVTLEEIKHAAESRQKVADYDI